MGVTLRYTRDQLIALRDVRASTSDVTAGAHPVHRRRRCRAGHHHQSELVGDVAVPVSVRQAVLF